MKIRGAAKPLPYKTEKRMSMWIQIAVGGLFCLLGIFELGCAIYAKRYCSESVQAEVILVDKDFSSPTVRYTVDGTEYETELEVDLHNKHRYTVHDACMVRVHPENPEHCVADNGVNPFALYSAVILLSILFIVLSYLKILNLGLPPL